MKNDTSTIKAFVQQYQKEQKIYEAWGEFVKNYINDQLNTRYISIDRILKLPASCRIKDVDSLVEKAFFRNKPYEDPYNEITDKVGIRFVVMHVGQLNTLCDIVEQCPLWIASKDIDFHLSRENNPDVFTYESIHYIVRNINEFLNGEYKIPANTPCEIQIRTLEQHAYAEISHDLFYKKEKKDNTVARYLARTAAFNEESDELFKRIYEKVEERELTYENLMSDLMKKYTFYNITSDKLNFAIYDNIEPIIKEHNITAQKVIDFVEENTYILDDVKNHQEDNILLKQPITLILYYILMKNTHELDEIWDFPEEMLIPIKSSLGIAYD